MKMASLTIGIGLMILSGIGIFVCLFLVSTTKERVSLDESWIAAIPTAFLFFLALGSMRAANIRMRTVF